MFTHAEFDTVEHRQYPDTVLACREGIIIIQDMPSMYFAGDLPGRLHPEILPGEKQQFEAEFKRMIEVGLPDGCNVFSSCTCATHFRFAI